MANPNAIYLLGNAIKRTLLTWALPRIAELQPGEWDEALKRARDTNFDTTERIGMLAGIVVVTYLLGFDANQAAAPSLPVGYFIQFLAAVPLLVLIVGPFYLRRTRRGLDQEIERRHGPAQSDPQR